LHGLIGPLRSIQALEVLLVLLLYFLIHFHEATIHIASLLGVVLLRGTLARLFLDEAELLFGAAGHRGLSRVMH
jgi:hypothetical protein